MHAVVRRKSGTRNSRKRRPRLSDGCGNTGRSFGRFPASGIDMFRLRDAHARCTQRPFISIVGVDTSITSQCSGSLHVRAFPSRKAVPARHLPVAVQPRLSGSPLSREGNPLLPARDRAQPGTLPCARGVARARRSWKDACPSTSRAADAKTRSNGGRVAEWLTGRKGVLSAHGDVHSVKQSSAINPVGRVGMIPLQANLHECLQARVDPWPGRSHHVSGDPHAGWLSRSDDPRRATAACPERALPIRPRIRLDSGRIWLALGHGKRVVCLSDAAPRMVPKFDEAVLTLLSLERGGAEPVCLAPDLRPSRGWSDHLSGKVDPDLRAHDECRRRRRRIARGQLRGHC